MRDGVLCLVFRVRDIYGKHWTKTIIKAVLIKQRMSLEGELLPYYFENMKLDKHGFLFWPQEIVHRITPKSPLWTTSHNDLYKSRFEIMVVLEGDSTTTGQPLQKQTSYTNKEISWGCRFVSCIDYNKDEHKYVVQHEKFNDMEICHAPLCSAEELNEALPRADNNICNFDLPSNMISPVSDNVYNSLKTPSGYRMRKNNSGGVTNENIQDTLETVKSTSMDDPKKYKREPSSTSS